MKGTINPEKDDRVKNTFTLSNQKEGIQKCKRKMTKEQIGKEIGGSVFIQ